MEAFPHKSRKPKKILDENPPKRYNVYLTTNKEKLHDFEFCE